MMNLVRWLHLAHILETLPAPDILLFVSGQEECRY